MISVQNLSYSFPEKELYNKISFTMEEHQHCAFIGASGTGKTTLADLILDPEKYLYDGKIEIPENFRIGYVRQFSELNEASDVTVFEYLAEPFLKLQDTMTALCAEMETASSIDSLLEEYQHTLDLFDVMGGSEFESTITKKLNLAGLNRHGQLKLSQLSGGEWKLVQVIRSMLINPNLIIMDEPDVFLDFERLAALKDLLNSHNGMLLVITHNRFLLHHCFNKIIHLENTQLQEFEGRYIEYHFALLCRKIELQEQAQKDTEEIERSRQVLERMRNDASNHISPKKGRSVHAKASHLKRLEDRRIQEPFVNIRQPEITLFAEHVSTNTVALKVEDYSIAFDDALLEHVSFEMNAADKVALIGPNGTGKTTLLREIFQNHHPAINISGDIKPAFLSQIQGEMLNDSHTILEEFEELGQVNLSSIENHLKLYGLNYSLHQKVNALSGGEKNLLQLAKIAFSDANLLLLDEPTSHLDTYSQIALEDAIKNYNGTVLMASHDFYTIANCVDYVLLIEHHAIRKISSRKFRKMVYANHFDKSYLEQDQKKKELEAKITLALKEGNTALAKSISEKLGELIKKL